MLSMDKTVGFGCGIDGQFCGLDRKIFGNISSIDIAD
jgi:hypothetical protein